MANTNEKVVEFLGLTKVALEKADKELATLKGRQAPQDKIAAAADALVEHGRIKPQQKEAAVKALSNHTEAVELVRRLAVKQAAGAPEPIGRVDKTASAAVKPSNIPVGARSTEPRESDLAYERRLGISR